MNIRFGGPMTPAVKQLMILNGSVFILQQIAGLFSPNMLEAIFGLSHGGFVGSFMLWQPVSYMFLHGGWLHIFFNLLGLWMFGGELEQIWGKNRFFRYYILSGIGAGLFIAIMNYYVALKFGTSAVTIGASGAIYAILLAYGLTWPNREVLLYFLFPIKIKYLLIAFGLMEFFGTLSSAAGTGGNISHIGHVGGLITGFILYRSFMKSKGKSNVVKLSFFKRITKGFRLKQKKKQIDTRIEAKKIIDEILGKIARSGMSSLTPEEKKKLEWARKHYYPSNEDVLH
jgi:membrane associated rhomboid family serine protease